MTLTTDQLQEASIGVTLLSLPLAFSELDLELAAKEAPLMKRGERKAADATREPRCTGSVSVFFSASPGLEDDVGAQTLKDLSSEQVTKREPAASKLIAQTVLSWPSSVSLQHQSSPSGPQTFTVSS
eukprot:CAMPEP_0197690746 /NCGR_PEP_ID=MMETSP1338-20131121/108772_1 /TAXON_ID=43686 ORGANISM="Pelagodinium beii, Strain RCC1491" /NCGR_SAMPLE_ID=MMETSP1338 /ASSEMBLY_ACC=CAM_ASM_000754 /LENGTH=126 /DNA_ID=CAMNT_0043273223 /DNA_START=132 /DNA_END=512 /DNA_ORIENTATION=+